MWTNLLTNITTPNAAVFFYKDSFLKEQLEYWVDNLNILYVAFTRATANLIVIGQSKERGFGVSTLMQQSLAKLKADNENEKLWMRRYIP